MEGSPARRAARRGAPLALLLAGAGTALALHRPAPAPSLTAAPPRIEAFERAWREQHLGAAEESVRLLRGLELHLAERRSGP